jgi:hypothetical protein
MTQYGLYLAPPVRLRYSISLKLTTEREITVLLPRCDSPAVYKTQEYMCSLSGLSDIVLGACVTAFLNGQGISDPS